MARRSARGRADQRAWRADETDLPSVGRRPNAGSEDARAAAGRDAGARFRARLPEREGVAMWPVLLLVATAAAPDSGRALTLAEAVSMAERQAPQVVVATGTERAAAAQVRSAYGAFLPSLSLSAGANRQYPSGGAATRIENGQ